MVAPAADTAAVPGSVEPAGPPVAGSVASRVLGWLLLAPAVGLLVFDYVVPTLRIVRSSFRDDDLFAEGGWVGGANYAELGSGGFGQAVGFALSLVVVPLLAITVVGLAIAYAASRAGRPVRRLVPLALVLPVVAYAPMGFVAGWRLDRMGWADAFGGDTGWVVRLAVWLTTFGMLAGVGALVYLATLRPAAAGQRRVGTATVVAGVVLGLATLAAGLQAYTYSWLDNASGTPLRAVGFGLPANPVPGARAGVSVLLGLLAVLGVAAVVLVVVSGLRIEVRSRDQEAAPAASRGWASGAGFAGGVVLAVTGFGLWPWLRRLFSLGDAATYVEGGGGVGSVLASTWLPPLAATAAGMAVAVLAGFAIGGLRPLSRFSPWLLLLFAPWLFVGNGVLVGDSVRWLTEGLTRNWLAEVPPGWVVVPAVVVFALLFAGQRHRWHQLRADGVAAGRALARAMVRPALPMLLLVGVATWVVQSQGTIWNFVSTTRLGSASAPRLTLLALRPEAPGDPPVALVLPFLAVLALAALLAVLQLTYLERLAIRTRSRSL